MIPSNQINVVGGGRFQQILSERWYGVGFKTIKELTMHMAAFSSTNAMVQDYSTSLIDATLKPTKVFDTGKQRWLIQESDQDQMSIQAPRYY